MKSVSIAPIRWATRPPKGYIDSPETLDEETAPQNPMDFPLKLFSNDHLGLEAVTIDDVSASYFVTPDYKLYLKLLQICSVSPGPNNSADIDYSTLLPKYTPDVINRLDQTQGAAPLHYACLNGNLPLVSFIVENGGEIDIMDGNKLVTPFSCACAFGHLAIVQYLLDQGADINDGSKNGSVPSLPLLWAIRGTHAPIVQLLLDKNASQVCTNPFSETLLHSAVISGSPEILEMLIRSHGPNANADLQMGTEKDTPLHLATSGNYDNSLATAKILIEQLGVNVNCVNSANKTPLHFAAASHDPEMIKLLVSHWAKVNALDNERKTPIFYAINDSEDALNSLEMLIIRGRCDVNHQDKKGYTPLHLAGLLGAAGAAEILLMHGADFSIKTSDGTSALNLLRRKVPHISALLTQVFDKAVTVTNFHDPTSTSSTADRRDCRVKVNFACVLPSPPSHIPSPTGSPNDEPTPIIRKATRGLRFSSVVNADQDPAYAHRRKETCKIKCLLDEEEDDLLLHPVIHSFLCMKWDKARPVFLPTITFKIVMVILLSLYAHIPYMVTLSEKMTNASGSANASANATVSSDCVSPGWPGTPSWFKGMYYIVLLMAALKAIMEFTQIIRAPKTLRTLHPWISMGVLLTIIYFMSPGLWKKSACVLQKSMAALCVLLGWIDIWIDMSRFPQFGLSIRVFFQVFKNFFQFIVPHFCLLVGFLFSFSLLFHHQDYPEFSSLFLTPTKIIRIMAGDITIVSQSKPMLRPDQTKEQWISDILLVYVYTAYVLIVAIVLSNLLIGLAVNDIQGIFSDAARDKLAKQTLLLNTLESNFGGMWVRRWLPRLLRYTNVFRPNSQTKTLTFKPYDNRDTKLSIEQKKALLDIATVTTGGGETGDSKQGQESSVEEPSKNVRVWKNVVQKLRKSKGNSMDCDAEHKILMDRINVVVATFLKEKNRKSIK